MNTLPKHRPIKKKGSAYLLEKKFVGKVNALANLSVPNLVVQLPIHRLTHFESVMRAREG